MVLEEHLYLQIQYMQTWIDDISNCHMPQLSCIGPYRYRSHSVICFSVYIHVPSSSIHTKFIQCAPRMHLRALTQNRSKYNFISPSHSLPNEGEGYPFSKIPLSDIEPLLLAVFSQFLDVIIFSQTKTFRWNRFKDISFFKFDFTNSIDLSRVFRTRNKICWALRAHPLLALLQSPRIGAGGDMDFSVIFFGFLSDFFCICW